MRKRHVGTAQPVMTQPGKNWLPLEQIALVEVSSEDAAYPIENAFMPDAETGWRAALPGEQVIRIVFDNPQSLSHIRLLFVEHEIDRSQEFVLRWSADNGQTFHEIVRQQWNFSSNSAQETENYQVDLAGVTQLELRVVPDRSGGNARASLSKLLLA